MRNLRLVILAVAGVGFFVSLAKADPTVHYYITTTNATPTGGTWQVYADVSHDNDGLADFYFDVLGGGGVQVTSSFQLMAPHVADPSSQYNDGSGGVMGFNQFISGGTLTSGNRMGISATQTATDYGNLDDPAKDMGIFVGVGQEPSSASPQNGTQGPIDGSGAPTGLSNPIWDYQPLANLPGGGGLFFPVAGTLIEQGSYSITTPGSLTVQIHQGNGAQVLGTGEAINPGDPGYPGFYPGGDNVPWGANTPYQLGDTPFAVTTGDTIQVPEPAALGLLGMMLACVVSASRQWRRKLV